MVGFTVSVTAALLGAQPNCVIVQNRTGIEGEVSWYIAANFSAVHTTILTAPACIAVIHERISRIVHLSLVGAIVALWPSEFHHLSPDRLSCVRPHTPPVASGGMVLSLRETTIILALRYVLPRSDCSIVTLNYTPTHRSNLLRSRTPMTAAIRATSLSFRSTVSIASTDLCACPHSV